MLGGLSNKLSETIVDSADTIDASADVLLVFGTTQVNTINPPRNGGFSAVCYLVPLAGNLVLGTTGNISVGDTLTVNRLTTLVYSKQQGTWYIADPL